MSYNQTKGFTLLELSIVIVIIGLIVAGISVGQSLVQQAQIRGLMADVNEVKVAINSFKLQYDALPGDMINAHDYWDDGGDGVCGTATQCNGNGDKLIQAGSVANDREHVRAWQHLTLAGVYSGTFPGTDVATQLVSIGVNIPEGSIGGSGYNFCGCTLNGFFSSITNMILVGGYRANNALQSGPIPGITAAKMASIDTKMDDGAPDTGSVLAGRGTGAVGNCVTGGTLTSGDAYLVSDTTADCNASFLF